MTENPTPSRPGEPPASTGHVADMSPRPKRKRGAPFGNSNALRHGFYSRHFTSAENASLDADIKGEFIDEINIARINVLRLAELLKDHKNMSIADVIASPMASGVTSNASAASAVSRRSCIRT